MFIAEKRTPKEIHVPADRCMLTDTGKVIVSLAYCPELIEFREKAFEIDADRLYRSYDDADINSFIPDSDDEPFPLCTIDGDEEEKPDTENPDFITAELIRHIFADVNFIEAIDVTKAS